MAVYVQTENGLEVIQQDKDRSQIIKEIVEFKQSINDSTADSPCIKDHLPQNLTEE